MRLKLCGAARWEQAAWACVQAQLLISTVTLGNALSSPCFSLFICTVGIIRAMGRLLGRLNKSKHVNYFER